MLELRRAALLLAPLFMTACTLAPDYVRPEAPVSGAFPTERSAKTRSPRDPKSVEATWPVLA